MHELPVTQSICDIAVQEARRAGAQKVTEIRIKQGEYTGYVPEIVQIYFDLVSEGTIAEGAKLVIEPVPAVLFCRECGVESPGEHFRMRCPLCNSRNVELKSGREFYIDSLEVEDGD